MRCLDKITLGLQPARLYLLSAYTSVGKSQLAHQVALHVARHHGPVLMASLEMSDQELTAGAIAQETGIPVEALATHDVDERCNHDMVPGIHPITNYNAPLRNGLYKYVSSTHMPLCV